MSPRRIVEAVLNIPRFIAWNLRRARKDWQRCASMAGRWPGAYVSPDAILEGDIDAISIGEGSTIEAGVRISVGKGGSIKIGRDSYIHGGAIVMSYMGHIVVGDHCSVNPYSILYGQSSLTIGDNVRIAAHCCIVPSNHSFDSLDVPIHMQPLTGLGIRIGNDVWLGAGVQVLDGVTIGDGAVVGAGSVVTKDLESLSVNVGSPTRMLYKRDERGRSG